MLLRLSTHVCVLKNCVFYVIVHSLDKKIFFYLVCNNYFTWYVIFILVKYRLYCNHILTALIIRISKEEN